jgi:hypothetical protein
MTGTATLAPAAAKATSPCGQAASRADWQPPSATARVPPEGRLLRASRPRVGYCARPARGSATARVPPEGPILT